MSRIAFISNNNAAPWGGSEELWSKTAQKLKANGHEVFVHVPRWPNTPQPIITLEQLGCLVQKENIYDGATQFYQRILHKFLCRQFTAPDRWLQWLYRIKPELAIISQGSLMEGIACLRACKNLGIPYVIIYQLVTEVQWPHCYDDILLLRELLIPAKRVYCASQANIRLLTTMIGSELTNATVVRNPFSVSYNIELSYPPHKDKVHIAFPARFHTLHKGHDLVFRALSSEKWKARSIKVNVYGEGPHKQLLLSLHKMLNLTNVQFHNCQRMEEIYRQNHAMLLGSRMEGLPIVLVDAMLCSRVPIVTDVGGNRELVDDNINGFLAKAPTTELIDEALERAWQRRNEWQQMGVLAAIKARKVFPSDPVAIFSQEINNTLVGR